MHTASSHYTLWDCYFYFYHQIRSNITYLLVLQSWFIFSVILILLTFQSHFFMITTTCGHPGYDSLWTIFEYYAADNTQGDQCIPETTQLHHIFGYKQCDWYYDEIEYRYYMCIKEKETNMLLWMTLIIIICVLLQLFFAVFGESFIRILHQIRTSDELKSHVLQNKIQKSYDKANNSTTRRLRSVVDTITFAHNDKELLPIELREIIVSMIHSQLSKCQECNKIICEHIRSRYHNLDTTSKAQDKQKEECK
eukprot:835511_1